jgi:hypothetical protein
MGSLLLLTVWIALSAPGMAAPPPSAEYRSLTRNSASQNLQFVGTVDDFRNARTMAEAEAQMAQVAKMGVNMLRIVVTWMPGQARADDDFPAVCNAYKAAAQYGITVVLNIIPGWITKDGQHPPLRASAQNQFGTLAANYESLIYDPAAPCTKQPTFYLAVGNEPNNDLFWKPQAGAPEAYGSLVAKTYDLVKKKAREMGVNAYVLAGELSSTGDTAPADFIAGMVKAYRDSGRKNRIMDGWSYHPYGTSSSDSPETVHPGATIGTADYPRLVAALSGYDGTGQPGSTLDIWYTEYGVESLIPTHKSRHYVGNEPSTSGAVGEGPQGEFYNKYLRLANTQPNVKAAFIFLPKDEKELGRWQSSLFYRDGTPKTSLQPVLTGLRNVCGTCAK